MKQHIISLPMALAALLSLAACADDPVLPEGGRGDAFSPKGEMVDAYLNLSVGALSVSTATRATVEDTEEERTVNDLWVLQYDASDSNEEGQRLISAPQYVSVSGQQELESVPVRLSNNNGKPSLIYVVTNTASDNWARYHTGSGTYEGFMTVAELKAAAIPTPKPQRMEYDYDTGQYVPHDDGNLSIPMSGSREATVTDGSTVSVTVRRMFAKLCVRVDLSHFNEAYKGATVYDVTVGNIPEYSTVGALGNEDDTTQAGDYSPCGGWLTRAFANNETSDSTSETIYPYVIYIPENIQGVNGEQTDDKLHNIPDARHSSSATDALYVKVDIHAITQNGVTMGPYSFTAFPGGDETTDFNVRRNSVYYVTMNIRDLDKDDVMVPSANCIVCLSGQTTSFYPYYRPEQGGGYQFIDYLDYRYGEEADTTRRIDRVDILWQSKSKAGSGGYIGDNTRDSLVWIDDAPDAATDRERELQEYSRKIYVTIPDGEVGNAVVAAYNSQGEIIWSWHVWSRTQEDDPGNEGNGVLYYTYTWDSNAINFSDDRIAGYTVMNCNLGALANTPTSSDGSETFGTLYQWGRKDPFPAVTKIASGPTVYNSSTVGNYYGNDGHTAVGITEKAQTTSDLFHSLAGNNRLSEIGSAFEDYVGYSIKHPTVFICGTKKPGQLTESYTATLSNYVDPQDGNWLLDSEGDHFNRLWGGLDPEKDGVTKMFYTGYEDSQGHKVHIYDDYGDEKSIFDPCPYGWRVSPPDLWLGFTRTGLNPATMSDVNYQQYTKHGFYMYMDGWRDDAKVTSFFPCQGTRVADGCAYRVGTCGNYHNATADVSDRVNILHLHNDADWFRIFEVNLRYYVKSVCGPVRCVRMTSVSNKE
ncbi:MAG: hypothetical protein LUC44_03525 [Prevotellaceae bacterium]|nr:hypothetical protein [Prevotellaceae bacterium]